MIEILAFHLCLIHYLRYTEKIVFEFSVSPVHRKKKEGK